VSGTSYDDDDDDTTVLDDDVDSGDDVMDSTQ
jgi:hypothetical protein